MSGSLATEACNPSANKMANSLSISALVPVSTVPDRRFRSNPISPSDRLRAWRSNFSPLVIPEPASFISKAHSPSC